MINYPLGKCQKAVLQALSTFEKYFKGCGWVYLYHSDTVETLEGLRRRDLVQVAEVDGVTTYTLTEKGKDTAAALDHATNWLINEEPPVDEAAV